MVDFTPTSVLLEPNTPPWAQRFALRLAKTFQNVFPTQPSRLWDAGSVAGLPPASAWPGTIAMAGGVLYVSDGTSWNKYAPFSAIGNFAQLQGIGSNATLTAAQLGRYLVVFGTFTLTLPLANTCPSGSAFFIQSGGGTGTTVTIQRQGTNTLFLPTTGNGPGPYALAGPKFVIAVSDGVGAWYLSGSGF